LKYAIITGASKGLGASITKRLLQEGFGIFSISRSESQELRDLATNSQLFYKHFSCDLSDAKSLENTFLTIIDNMKQVEIVDELWVFNNAGVVEPIETVGNLDAASVELNIQINLLAPILISNLLIQHLNAFNLTIVNVTSGAAERPIHGWSTYCSTKAAVNMFTQSTALEQKSANNHHSIIGFSPGIMDTDMQQTIRSSSKEAFHDIERFRSYKEEGLLRSTDSVACALIDLLLSGKIESGTIYNVNQLI
jgi:benzil reductase ((S)-benzoin forming)